jgi:uncharacterized protein
MARIRVHKLDDQGQTLLVYDGEELTRDAHSICLEAFFRRDDYDAGYHVFRRGDRMVEWFYSDRWYNIFEMYDANNDQLTGWYCNVTRPARLEEDAIYAEDLALDLMVYPDGRSLVLDEDEFEALSLDDETRQNAARALQALQDLVGARAEVFSKIH